VRKIELRDVLCRYEAAELLGIGERTFRRWRQGYDEDGEAGLLDRRLGKASGKRVPLDREAEVAALCRTRYTGFTAKHFHALLVGDHKFAWGYTWTKAFLQVEGLIGEGRAARRAPARAAAPAARGTRPRRVRSGFQLPKERIYASNGEQDS